MRPIVIQPADPFILCIRGDEGAHHHHPHHQPCSIPDLTMERSRWSRKEEAARLLRIQQTSGVVVGSDDRRHYHHTNNDGWNIIQGRHILGTASSRDRRDHPKRRNREESNSTEMRNATTLDPIVPNVDQSPPVPHPRSASLPTSTTPAHHSSQPQQLQRRTGSILKTKTLTDSLAHGSRPEEGGGPHHRRTTASITFDRIEIREYARTVGDNPSCTAGPPIRYEKTKHTHPCTKYFVPFSHFLSRSLHSLSWEYTVAGAMDVHAYERDRAPRRRKNELLLSRERRQEMLRKEWQVTQRDIADAVRQTVKTRNQRRTTITNLDKHAFPETPIEVFVQSGKRKFQRFWKQRARILLTKTVSRPPRRTVDVLEDQLAASQHCRRLQHADLDQLMKQLSCSSDSDDDTEDINPTSELRRPPSTLPTTTEKEIIMVSDDTTDDDTKEHH